jgi:hypothetical protein
MCLNERMKNFWSKLDMTAIRANGQAYLAELEKHGHVLPSLEHLQLKATTPILQSHPTTELQGFAEDDHPPLNRKQ